jgi:septum formation protein
LPGGVSPFSHSIQSARSLLGSGGGRSMASEVSEGLPASGSPSPPIVRDPGGVTRRLVLASASPARLGVLRAAGLAPEVVVSGVDEDDQDGTTAEIALALAERKAQAVAERLGPDADAIVVGCDSVLDVDGETRGKPASTDQARAWWASVAGRTAVLHSGHCVIDTASGATASAVARTTVRFGCPTDAELDAYLATDEPLRVAGAFTIDGYAAPFLEGLDGDHGTVLGLSLPLLRRLLAEVGTPIVELWT